MILQLRMFDSVINSDQDGSKVNQPNLEEHFTDRAVARNFRIFPLLNTHGYRAGEGGGGYSRRC